ncbi:MAG: rhomboid family intramembrane serine protease [Phycisphaerales bacterium]|nr:rhomboid family intramembrane serine protease [Phycisphaerales bacterium]
MSPLPIRTPTSLTRTIIVLNIAFYFLAIMAVGSDKDKEIEFIQRFGANPQSFHWYQLFTSQFMHAGLMHLGFNMIGLSIFGPPLEWRLGKIPFLCLYLLGGAAGAFAHVYFERVPAIGASGAIYTLVGAFAVLFPRTRIGLIMVPKPVPAPVFALIYLLIDILGASGSLGGRGVANLAHIGGMGSGAVVAMAALYFGWIPRDGGDILFVIKQWMRRRKARAALSGPRAGPTVIPSQRDPESAEQVRRRGLRMDIARLHGERDLVSGAALYRQLRALDGGAVLPEGIQLDIANQLWALGDAAEAAAAWELHRHRYPHSPRANEIDLLLALAYGRRLNAPDRAREILHKLLPRLGDGSLATAAAQLSAELGG